MPDNTMVDERGQLGGLETDDLVQQAILYPKSPEAVADQFGNVRLDPPVTIKCRWRFATSLSATSQSTSVQVVATLVVDREIGLGSILKRTTDSSLYEVIGYKESWDVEGVSARRIATVSKWNGQLPAGV